MSFKVGDTITLDKKKLSSMDSFTRERVMSSFRSRKYKIKAIGRINCCENKEDLDSQCKGRLLFDDGIYDICPYFMSDDKYYNVFKLVNNRIDTYKDRLLHDKKMV